jgi:hypothetical protein
MYLLELKMTILPVLLPELAILANNAVGFSYI